jgi:hypothetical protein
MKNQKNYNYNVRDIAPPAAPAVNCIINWSNPER